MRMPRRIRRSFKSLKRRMIRTALKEESSGSELPSLRMTLMVSYGMTDMTSTAIHVLA